MGLNRSQRLSVEISLRGDKTQIPKSGLGLCAIVSWVGQVANRLHGSLCVEQGSGSVRPTARHSQVRQYPGRSIHRRLPRAKRLGRCKDVGWTSCRNARFLPKT